MDNEILRATAEKAAPYTAQGAAEIAVETGVARKRVCDVLDAPPSTIYARETAAIRNEDGVVMASPSGAQNRSVR
jgi:hypothetical protein